LNEQKEIEIPIPADTPRNVTERHLHRLSEAEWQAREKAHEDRIEQLIGDWQHQRSSGNSDPVTDFLFEYYRFRPSHLATWTPGYGICLSGPGAARFESRRYYSRTGSGIALDVSLLSEQRRRSLSWIRDLLHATQSRPPMYGCYGLHEWAMVYRTREIRHGAVPLRLSAEAINHVVESNTLACTHFDAFRFFTPDARPLNRKTLTRQQMQDYEQPGCLHTNMDVYRWAFKGFPWITSELIADAFELALDIRQVDMRASPYDLSAWNLAPINIETEAGQSEYRDLQQKFSLRAHRVRARLIDAYDTLVDSSCTVPGISA